MAKFTVKIKEIHTQEIDVEAANEAEALTIAETVLSTGVNQDGTDLYEKVVYHSTMDSDEWMVWPA